jgi:hypothetical protein
MGKINTHANSDGTSHSNVKKNNFTATTAPTKDDDSGDGYSVGSLWYYAAARKLFICFDATATDSIWKMVYSDALVKNTTGATINRGQVVYINGATGVNPTVALAKADAEATSANTIGLMLEDTINNGFGYVVSEGIIIGTGDEPIDTSAVAAGNPLFLSATTAGAFTGTAPTSPNHSTVVGKVITSHATLGSILVDVLNGYETHELHDVEESAATANGELLVWDNSASIYKVSTIASANAHLTVGYTVGGPTIDLTTVHTISYAPTGVEFGNTDQEYDVDGTTWVTAVAGGTLGGIPNEASGGHELSACLAAMATARDGSYLAVREDTGVASATNPNTVHFLFTSVTAFDTIEMLMQYNGGAGHVMAIELWDYVNSAYVRIKQFIDDSFFVDYAIKVHGSTNFVGTGGDAGKVIVQLIHDNAGNAAHNVQVDYIVLSEAW